MVWKLTVHLNNSKKIPKSPKAAAPSQKASRQLSRSHLWLPTVRMAFCLSKNLCLYLSFCRKCSTVLSSIVFPRTFPFSLIEGRNTALWHEAKEKVVCALVGVRAHGRGRWDSGTMHARFPAPPNPNNIYWNLCHRSDSTLMSKRNIQTGT